MNDEFNEADLRRIDLNLLVFLAALFRTRSVRRTAALLFVTPPAASMALARLRELTGDPLFVRTRAGMEPTPRAEALQASVAPALASLEHALLRRAPFAPAQTRRILRFGCPDDLGPFLAPRLLARLDREAPGVQLVLRPADLRSTPASLDAGDVDVALTATPPGLERRHRVQVLHQETFSVLHRRGLFGRAGLRTLPQYAAHPHVVLSLSGDRSGSLDGTLRALGVERRYRVVVSQFPLFPFLLEAGDCVGTLPSTAARLYAVRFELACAPLPFDAAPFDVALVWHARADADPAVAWFRGCVAAEVEAVKREARRRRRSARGS